MISDSLDSGECSESDGGEEQESYEDEDRNEYRGAKSYEDYGEEQEEYYGEEQEYNNDYECEEECRVGGDDEARSARRVRQVRVTR